MAAEASPRGCGMPKWSSSASRSVGWRIGNVGRGWCRSLVAKAGDIVGGGSESQSEGVAEMIGFR